MTSQNSVCSKKTPEILKSREGLVEMNKRESAYMEGFYRYAESDQHIRQKNGFKMKS